MNDPDHIDATENTPGWKDKALKFAGYGYSAGDLAMAAAAKLRGEKNVMGGALIWLAGGVAAARYGHPSPEAQVQLLSRRLEEYLQTQGIVIPDDVREQHQLLRKPGFYEQCQEFLYKHPSEMLNAAYGIGAMLLLKDGASELMRHEKKLFPVFTNGFAKESILGAANGISKNFWMGTLIGGGALAGIAVKENPDARKKAAHGNLFQKAAAYIEEKPLRITGTLYGLNNIFTVLKAVEDHGRFAGAGGALKPHYFSGTTAATYILSNMLLSTVSRDHTLARGLPEGTLTPLQNAAARVVAAQPEEKRQALIRDMAEFLSTQKEVGQSKEVIQEKLSQQLNILMAESPAAHTSWVNRTAANPSMVLEI